MAIYRVKLIYRLVENSEVDADSEEQAIELAKEQSDAPICSELLEEIVTLLNQGGTP